VDKTGSRIPLGDSGLSGIETLGALTAAIAKNLDPFPQMGCILFLFRKYATSNISN
jgi:hypothetical protein